MRNVAFEDASDAGLRPEREKAGLLPSRPVLDGLPAGDSGLRLADVWFPRGDSGHGEAWGFAVLSGMRTDLIRVSADSHESIFTRYEAYKRAYKQTAESCETQGFRFIPMILEAHAGGWCPTARGVLDWIARQSAACHGEAAATTALRIAQRMSITLQRENARAVLKRMVVPERGPPPSGWEAPHEWQ